MVSVTEDTRYSPIHAYFLPNSWTGLAACNQPDPKCFTTLVLYLDCVNLPGFSGGQKGYE